MAIIDIVVDGMSCGGCTSSVTRVLSAIDGVNAVDVTLDPPRARVDIDPARIDNEQLVAAIVGAGFAVPSPPVPAASPRGG